jgi:hypothetical protein
MLVEPPLNATEFPLTPWAALTRGNMSLTNYCPGQVPSILDGRM